MKNTISFNIKTLLPSSMDVHHSVEGDKLPSMDDNREQKRRIVLWLSVIVYTLSLPYAIVIYESITLKWSPEIAGLIPRVILLIAGMIYLFVCVKFKLPFRRVLLVIPCAILALLIVYLESNPNKHIHIPEYILMSWLLFEAVRYDYKGRTAGTYVFIFLTSSFLGVFDEILQGLHHSRSYGWQDMTINCASSFIGVLSLMGLREKQKGGWNWSVLFGRTKGFLPIIMIGIVSSAVNCALLFVVRDNLGLWTVYPDLLVAWDMMFVVFGVTALLKLCGGMINVGEPRDQDITSRISTFVFLSIALAIHVVIVVSRLSGASFQ